jgi:hypothetical protein
MLQIKRQIWFHNRQLSKLIPPSLIQLGERRAWNKWWFQLFYIRRRFIWIIFPEFLKKGFDWQGSKRVNCTLAWNLGLTSYWSCTTRLIVLQETTQINKPNFKLNNVNEFYIYIYIYLIIRPQSNLPYTPAGKSRMPCVQWK